MKIPPFLKPFPDDSRYRLIDSYSIKRKNENVYVAKLVFQQIPTSHNANEQNQPDNFAKFKFGERLERDCPLCYLRAFVLGSIWSNVNRDEPSFPSDYFSSYSITDPSFLKNKLNVRYINEIISKNYIPIARVEYKSNSYGDDIIQNIPYKSPILCFYLNEPLYFNKKENNIIPLRHQDLGWNRDSKTEFIAFYNYEVYRYFYTSCSSNDLSERLLTTNLNPLLQRPNEVYDPILSVYDQEKDEYPIYLKYHQDEYNLEIIGNIVAFDSFHKEMIRLGERLNLNKSPFHAITRIPVDTFDELIFVAKPVKDIKGRKGLLIFEIQRCKGYQKSAYRAIVPVPKQDSQENYKLVSGGGSKRSSSKKDDDVEPEIITDRVASPNNPEHEFENDLWMSRMQSNANVKIAPRKTRVYKVGQGVFTDEGDESIAPPGTQGNGREKQGKTRIQVDPTDYFSFFPEIVAGIELYIQKLGYACSSMHLNDDLKFVQRSGQEALHLNSSNLTLQVENKTQLFYMIQLKVSSPPLNDPKYYYLFARRHERFINEQARTWLHSVEKFRPIEEDEIEIKRLLKEYIDHNGNSKDDKEEPNHKFNHLSSKRLKNDDSEVTYIQVDIEEAKKNHVEKIANWILKSAKN